MLTTPEKLKRHLGIPASDTLKDQVLTDIVTGVSGLMESAMNRKLGIADYTAKLDGDGGTDLFLPQLPLVEVTAVSVDGSALTVDDEITAKTLIVENGPGILHRPSGWPVGRRNIEVTYRAGFVLPADQDESGESQEGENLPADIEHACIRISARVYERKTAEGVTSVTSSNLTAAYKDALDPDLEAVIAARRKINL